LFTRYLYPFELTSILLLAAIVGAVVIARKENAKELHKSGQRAAIQEKKSEMTVDEVTN